MHAHRQEPIIIELDDPTPRWLRYFAVVAGIVVILLLFAPQLIDIRPSEDVSADQNRPVQSAEYAPVCQPTIELPSFAQPAASMAIPSWMRLCDWFAEPAGRPIALPTEPAAPPRGID